MIFSKNKQGFTMPQLIITLAILLILAAAVFTWIDPLARIGEAKNKRRIQDINILATAISNYASDHRGNLPVLGSVTTDKKILCSSQSGSNLSCAGDSQLCLTVDDDFYKYMGRLSHDPDKSAETDTGYYLQKDANDNLIVGACATYNSEEIIKKPSLKVSCSLYAGGHCWYPSVSDDINCDDVCAAIGLDCVKGVSYGPDVDSDGSNYCALQRNIDSNYCTAGCGSLTAGVPPSFNGIPACDIQAGSLLCHKKSDQTEYPVCPCN
jgi:prepilin-type N-terminal cleavage/methylation domain-containing protein